MKAQGVVFRGVQVFLPVSGVELFSAPCCCCVMQAAAASLRAGLRMLLSSGERNSIISHVLERLEVRDGVVLQVVPLVSFFCWW